MSSGLDVNGAIAWVRGAAAKVAADEARLTQLDAVIGDGDHGANLNRGLTAAMGALSAEPPATPGKVLVAAGRALISKTGGAAGPLYGTALRRAGRAFGDADDVSVTELGGALQAMLDGIRELGGAAEGDKTMVDALAPAVAAYQAATADGASLAAAAKSAAAAADEGRAATVPMQARKGRASYLGERSVGHEDPGAASMALFLAALAEALPETLEA